MKRTWSWGPGQVCEIRGEEIVIATMNPFGGDGASCTLTEFLEGRLTWLLPDGVRGEALASAQAILNDHRALKPAVSRGDQTALDPQLRRERKERARIEARTGRTTAAETRRLRKRVTEKELPDRTCFVCRRLLERASGSRQAFEASFGRFPHEQHAPALEVLESKLVKFAKSMNRLPLEECEICRALPEASRSTYSQELPREARRIVDLPATTPLGPSHRQCPVCGRVYLCTVTSYDSYETPSGSDPHENVRRLDLNEIRDGLRNEVAAGDIPEWVARALPR